MVTRSFDEMPVDHVPSNRTGIVVSLEPVGQYASPDIVAEVEELVGKRDEGQEHL